MPRLITALLAIAGSLLLAVIAIVLLASITGPRAVSSVAIPTLTAPVELEITEAGVIQLRAQRAPDLFAGLGYGHALRHAWTMTLLKVTASGRLSQARPDPAALAIDRQMALLGIPATARRAYRAMPDSVRALFDAYADGVNTAFIQNRLARSDEFIVLPIEHETWEPWHPIAIELLVAYLGATAELQQPPEARAARPPREVRQFLTADSLLHVVLGVAGWQHSVAFAAPDTAGTVFVHRLVYGATGLPLVQPADVTLGDASLVLSTIPGTLALPGGFAEDRAWAVVPAPAASIRLTTATPPDPQHGRVIRRDGSEILVSSRRSAGRLFIEEGAMVMLAPDTLEVEGEPPPTNGQDDQVAEPPPGRGWWVLEWAGVATRSTDISAWMALMEGRDPSFEVLSGATVIMDAAGQARVLGTPAFATSIPGGLVVGGSDLARHVADRLAADAAPEPEQSLAADTYSAWAARLAPPLVAAVGHPDSVEVDIRDAVAFLVGWNHRYDGDDIAASIFDRWMYVYHRNTGRLPEPDTLALQPVERVDTLHVPFAEIVAEELAEARRAGRRAPPIADTLAAHPERADSLVAVTRTRVEDPHDLRVLKHALQQAVGQLEEIYGRPGPGWRWHRVQNARLRFPGRTDRPGDAPAARRYGDVPLGDGGHPTTVRWGPSMLFPGTQHPTAWSAWTSTADWGRIGVLLREPFREALDVRYADPPQPTRTHLFSRGAPIQRPVRLVPTV